MTDAATKLTVLLVEDTLSLARTYKKYLRDQPYDLVHVETGGAALQALERHAPDAVLLDLMLPDMDGLEILRHIAEEGGRTAVVVIAARRSIATAVEAMRLGAFDFLVKPFSAERLGVTLHNALERQRLTRIVETYKNDFNREEYCGFIGSSLPMQALYRIVDSAAGSKATVFITGESGTGKEICAEAIHCQSPRVEKPFVVLNCGAIPRDLLESEIFGHVKGAFTGAISEREGAASRANGGTLFLDEVCELAPNLQTKLLRFVQTGTFQKVGGSKTEDVDIRFVCATNSDPVREVARGRFREDLFYRLHVIPIHVPPLRERDDDVLAIARKFLSDIAREEGKAFTRFAPETEAVFRDYAWPGNVRQLQNMVRNIVVLNAGEVVTLDMLPAPLDRQGLLAGEAGSPSPDAGALAPGVPALPVNGDEAAAAADPQNLIRPLAEVEKAIIERAISLCDGNIPRAAAHLRISASTIYRKRANWGNVGNRVLSVRRGPLSAPAGASEPLT